MFFLLDSLKYIENMHGEQIHRYLNRTLVGDLVLRTDLELDHRLRVVWAKFHKYKSIILNKHVSLELGFIFFHSVVPPTATFGLAVSPLKIH